MDYHHAYVTVVVNPSHARDFLPETNAERVVLPYELLGITEARELTEIASRLPTNASKRELVIVTSAMTYEAGQALLKLLEDPPATTRFWFLIAPSVQLLPTLRSRLMSISLDLPAPVVASTFADFSAASLRERLATIERAHKSDVDTWFLELKAGLAAALANRTLSLTPTTELVLRLLCTRGASNKMLAELLAVSLPAT